jgi:hypothetical protein
MKAKQYNLCRKIVYQPGRNPPTFIQSYFVDSKTGEFVRDIHEDEAMFIGKQIAENNKQG